MTRFASAECLRSALTLYFAALFLKRLFSWTSATWSIGRAQHSMVGLGLRKGLLWIHMLHLIHDFVNSLATHLWDNLIANVDATFACTSLAENSALPKGDTTCVLVPPGCHWESLSDGPCLREIAGEQQGPVKLQCSSANGDSCAPPCLRLYGFALDDHGINRDADLQKCIIDADGHHITTGTPRATM